MTDFPALLSRFTKAVAANDGAAFSGLFTEDGVYDDGFFGEYKGRKAIAEMLQHFHDTGSNYRWDFLDPLSDGHQAMRAIASATRRACRARRASRWCSREPRISCSATG